MQRKQDDRTSAEIKAMAQSVRIARVHAQLTQAQLAAAIGTNQGNIARIESGRHAPSFRTLQAIARATDSRLALSYVPLPSSVRKEERNHRMSTATPTLRRRSFVGGVVGLTTGMAMLRTISAEEGTAIASASPDYVWTPPQWDPETPFFTVLSNDGVTAQVETPDGVLEVPTNPERLVALDEEYIALYELGVWQPLVGIGLGGTEDRLENAGEISDDLHRDLNAVPRIPEPWELDVETVLALEPDLILGSFDMQPDEVYCALSTVAPFIRKRVRVLDVPRQAVRDLGALFDKEEVATTLVETHDQYVAETRESIAPLLAGKKVLVGWKQEGSEEFFAAISYYSWDGMVNTLSYSYPFFRELELQPSSFIELIGEADDRANGYTIFSMELLGQVDADILIYPNVYGDANYDEFMADPLVQQLPFFQNGQVYKWETAEHGFGLAGVQSTLAWFADAVHERTGTN
ncbi:MAG: ABC transporter substrate-binding protein [Thermomicrobiales bacterium]|nr:ABC transporter substrate-binding protein [Thermomicrobiales bacterium]